MRIAISSIEDNENSKISEISGRSPFYLIFEDKKLVKKIKNPFKFGGGGAGFSIAQMLANENVDVVVSGKIGPNMENALKEKGIKIKEEKDKTVKEIIEQVNKDAKTKT